MTLENLFDSGSDLIIFIKKNSRTIVATLALSSLLMNPTTSYALIDGDGRVMSVDGKSSCQYKGHRLVIGYDFINGRERWVTYKAYNLKGQEVDLKTLHPSRLIEYDPNTGFCRDIDEPPDPNFLCC